MIFSLVNTLSRSLLDCFEPKFLRRKYQPFRLFALDRSLHFCDISVTPALPPLAIAMLQRRE
jgi:hypothetical protein